MSRVPFWKCEEGEFQLIVWLVVHNFPQIKKKQRGYYTLDVCDTARNIQSVSIFFLISFDSFWLYIFLFFFGASLDSRSTFPSRLHYTPLAGRVIGTNIMCDVGRTKCFCGSPTRKHFNELQYFSYSVLMDVIFFFSKKNIQCKYRIFFLSLRENRDGTFDEGSI